MLSSFQSILLGQTTYLKLEFSDTNNIVFQNSIEKEESFSSKKKLLLFIDELSNHFNNKGFISHSINLYKENDSLYRGFISLDLIIKKILLKFKTDFKLPPFIKDNEITIDFEQLEKTLKSIYDYYEKDGATFTEITLNEITIKNNNLFTEVKIHKSQNRTIDKTVIKGYTNFPRKFLKYHFRLKRPITYNKKSVEFVSNSIQTLEFIKEDRKPEVLFTKDSTHLYVYVSKKNANRFDGLIGFTSDEENGKFIFNGYLDIELSNSFNKGELLSVYWSNNGKEQERFRFKTAIPYIFNSPISPEIKFETYKQDSSFINIDFDINLKYSINKKNTLGGVFASKKSTDLSNNIKNPLINSYNTLFYGVTHQYVTLTNNRNKFLTNSSISYGNKTSNETKTAQYKLSVDLLLDKSISKKSNLYIYNKTETLQSSFILYNELFQIGGANTIRGFYEQSIFCSAYNFTNLEYRLLTNSESFLYIFSDIGFTKDQTINITNKLYSFGLGYAYKTKGGVINLNYAFGKKNTDSFNYNEGIFHIKLTTSF